MPKEGSILKFRNFFWKMRVPFVVYADFECFAEKLDTTQPNSKQSYTKQYQKHTPSGFCYYIKYFDDSVYKQEPVIYTKQSEDEDVAQIFFHKLVEDLKGIYRNCGKAKMTITPNQQRKFQKATKCWICGDKLVTDKGHQDYKKNNQSEITVILLANTEDLLIMSAIFSLENQSSPLYSSIIYLAMTLICSSRTLARLKVKLSVFLIMKRGTSASLRILKFIATQTKRREMTCI